jgi:diazepam-binding inhibitor (GABA receptor modulating acyl-CoA-binding protein)
MAGIDEEFQAAVAEVSGLTTDPGNDTKLRLYALYKQASVGDVSGSRPGPFSMVARAKYDAWAATSGMSADDAKRAYVDTVRGLRP